MGKPMVDDWETIPLTARRISEETCSKWKYGVGDYKGRKVQCANYFRDGQLVAQKVRFPDKGFTFLGDPKRAGLYGQHLWRDGGKHLVITEGEIDALSVSQMFNNKYPVVSVPNGANGAARTIAKEIEWIDRFESVVFMFDMDDPGQEAARECAALLKPGQAKVAQLPLKDANEMLKAGRGSELIDAFWSAKEWRPDGIVHFGDLKDKIFQTQAMGTPWMFQELTDLTFGRQEGAVYTIGAGTGIGKTDFLTQQIEYDANELDIKCGILFLEQSPVETAKRIAGKFSGKRFHLPPEEGGWHNEELVTAFDKLDSNDNIILYDHFGTTDWDVIKQRIRYMAVSEGCKHIYLDHITALAALAEDERKEIEGLMAEIAGMAQELKIIMHVVSHLATPEGKPHEEGGRVTIRHFKGSRSIGFWSHGMFGLERNQHHDDPEWRSVTTFRILKDRYTGQSTGATLALHYTHETGRLHIGEFPEKKSKVNFEDDESDF